MQHENSNLQQFTMDTWKLTTTTIHKEDPTRAAINWHSETKKYKNEPKYAITIIMQKPKDTLSKF